MKFETLWESKGGIIDSLDMRARITKIDGEYNMEILFRDENSFWKRVKVAVMYIFLKSSILFGIIPLSKEDIEKLKELSDYVEK